MKKATCKQLKGACEEQITGNNPQEMGENSRNHVMKMVEAEDQAHLNAVEEMKKLSPAEQQKWYQDFADNFNELEEV